MTTNTIPAPAPLRGILLKLGSVALFTVMAALLKATASEVPPGEQVFFRSLFALPVTLIWLGARGQLGGGLRVRQPLSHVWRGLVGAVAMGCGFAGLGLLPFPEATALNYAMPLLTVIFAAMFLGEDVRVFRLAMVALGLAGVLIVLSPRLGGFGGDIRQTLGAVLTLVGAAFGALAQIFIRRMVGQESVSAIVFWFSATTTVLSLITLPFGWVVPTAGTTMLLISCGIIGGVAQILLTTAYRYADASVVAPFDYASMLLALVIGWYGFGEAASPVMLAGSALVIAAGIAIAWREGQLGRERRAARRAMTPHG